MKKIVFTQSCESVEFSTTETCLGQFLRYDQEGTGRGPNGERYQEVRMESGEWDAERA